MAYPVEPEECQAEQHYSVQQTPTWRLGAFQQGCQSAVGLAQTGCLAHAVHCQTEAWVEALDHCHGQSPAAGLEPDGGQGGLPGQ